MFIKLFGKSITQLEQALDVRSKRNTVITSNITNQDTPGYKSKEIDFKKALEVASNSDNSLALRKTNSNHLTSKSQMGKISPEVTLSATKGTKRLDGNTVNAEMEMTRLAENTLMYQATTQFIAKKFRGLKYVINEGR